MTKGIFVEVGITKQRSIAGMKSIQARPCKPGRKLPCGGVLVANQRCYCKRHKAGAAFAPAPAAAALLIHCGRQEASLKNFISLYTVTSLLM